PHRAMGRRAMGSSRGSACACDRDLLAFVSFGLQGRRLSREPLATARAHATSARKRAREAATAVVQQIEANPVWHQPWFVQLINRFLEFLRAYLGLRTGLTSLMRGDRLVVFAAAGNPGLGPGTDITHKLPQCNEVLETGSSLMLA